MAGNQHRLNQQGLDTLKDVLGTLEYGWPPNVSALAKNTTLTRPTIERLINQKPTLKRSITTLFDMLVDELYQKGLKEKAEQLSTADYIEDASSIAAPSSTFLDSNYQLEAKQSSLKQLDHQIVTANNQLQPPQLASIQEQKQQLESEIAELEQQEDSLYATPTQWDDLIAILNTSPLYMEILESIYLQTIQHWRTVLEHDQISPAAIVNNLFEIGVGQSAYSAIEEFVIGLTIQTQFSDLARQIETWGHSHYPQPEWSALKARIQPVLSASTTTSSAAIFLSISLDEQKTTESENVPHYQYEAWLIPDLDLYRHPRPSQRRCQPIPLSSVPTPSVEKAALESSIQPCLQQWTQKLNAKSQDSEEPAEFYVFLPRELLTLEVDNWSIDQAGIRRLGHEYAVILCSVERYQNLYPRHRWNHRWKGYQQEQDKIADLCFVEGSDQDIQLLRTNLGRAKQESRAIYGLKMSTAPQCNALTERLFNEICVQGLPVAIWARCTHQSICNLDAISAILRETTLAHLAKAIFEQRWDAHDSDESSPHIGHHLALLLDSPDLRLPSYRRTA